ncbi:MAG: hypothetical protein KDA05_10735 [Phycisphaerales bacterium]|nr:hypothetical protein [Phycisphaerales bacterium]MCB9841079.1 hypothetical protein [Phycisphaeraceae bacterium]
MTDSLLNKASHLAVPLGLYTAAGVVAVAQAAGQQPRALWLVGLGFAFCTGTGAYLLDRVKLRDAWADPPDRRAHPARAAFIGRHRHAVRWLIVILTITGGALGALLSWVLVAGLVAMLVGVFVYAGRPRGRRARPKDVLLAKNAFVAVGITGLASATAWSIAGGLGAWRGAALAIGHVFVRVLADSVLCDLDDAAADGAFGTETIATRFGAAGAWAVSDGLRLVMGVVMLLVPWGAWWPRMAWGVATIVSTLGLRTIRPKRVRDWVDLRLPLEAAVVAAVLVFV